MVCKRVSTARLPSVLNPHHSRDGPWFSTESTSLNATIKFGQNRWRSLQKAAERHVIANFRFNVPRRYASPEICSVRATGLPSEAFCLEFIVAFRLGP